jgi:hypothetical protein
MSPDKTKQLVEICPEIFQKEDKDPRGPLDFYFQCHDGWFDILKECISEIKSIIDSRKFDFSEFSPKVAQIKEKYGALRFYLEGPLDMSASDALHDVIDAAEAKSLKVCEICGDKGSSMVTPNRWIVCRCKKCHP